MVAAVSALDGVWGVSRVGNSPCRRENESSCLHIDLTASVFIKRTMNQKGHKVRGGRWTLCNKGKLKIKTNPGILLFIQYFAVSQLYGSNTWLMSSFDIVFIY